MKKLLFTLALATATFAARPSAAQSSPAAVAPAPAGYTGQLAQAIQEVTHTGDPATLATLAAKMERAASVAPADWLPRYYQAYALIISAFQSKEEAAAKDQALDRAEAALAQARQLKGDESELLTLQAYIYQARLGLDPMQRSRKYAPLVNEAVALAKTLNPANPRPYLVGANQVYYTPAMFGGGADKAKPLYEEAQAKFAAYQPASPLLPNWGEGQVQGRLKTYAAAPAPAAAK